MARFRASTVAGMPDAPDIRCKCGKFKYRTKESAIAETENYYGFRRYYWCDISETYHITSMKENDYNVKVVDQGSEDNTMGRSMAFAREIEEFIKNLYRDTKTYKVSSKMVCEAFPRRNKSEVYSELSRMRRDGTLIFTGEKVPDQKGARYFAHTDILDKVTSPTPYKVVTPTAIVKSETKTGNIEMVEKIPTQPVSNPFDDVKLQLAEIKATLANLNPQQPTETDVKGYFDNKFAELFKRFDKSPSVSIETMDVYFKGLHDLLRINFEATNTNLGALLANENGSYRILNSKLIEVLESRNESDEYKRGIKDGIRIAVEMGIFIPDGE
ncbi:hypothetical protein [Chitinophaga sp.]|uniref:hypothetical protein n=1 Tax=Chitinophaga sp. TaxID=1869181 RepID=UPI002F926DF7